MTELMSGALKYCGDMGEEGEGGERGVVRAAMVHHRLARKGEYFAEIAEEK